MCVHVSFNVRMRETREIVCVCVCVCVCVHACAYICCVDMEFF